MIAAFRAGHAAIRRKEPGARTMAEMVAEVAAEHGVTVAALRGPGRSRRLAWPRQEAMLRCREEIGYSYRRIGRFFGDRDHTTVMHGCEAARARRSGA